MVNRRQMLVRGAVAAGASAVVGGWRAKAAAAATSPAVTPITLNVNGFTFNALSCGPTSGVLMLCTHGFPQFKESWLPVLQALGGDGFWVVAPDQRGYSVGAQPPDVGSYSQANLVSDVLGFAAALGRSTFHLVGHDFGAFVNWQVAAQFPQQIITLTSFSTPHRDAYSAALSNDPVQQKLAAYIQVYQQPTAAAFLLANNGAVLTAGLQGTNPGDPPAPGTPLNVVPAAEIATIIQRMSQGTTMQDALNWYLAADLGLIGPVTVPTTYCWGSNDQALGATAAINTANFCPGIYTFVQLTGRSHWLLDEVPDDVVAIVRQQVNSTLT
jgi:pimeloyl-ACP methyl ester carboxylesterase